MELSKNAERFCGFSDLYERARPTMPLFPVQVLTRYLGRRPDTVVDLGCGTGLSSTIWKGRCRRVIGVEPNGEMLAVAGNKADRTLSFIPAYAHDTGLAPALADIVICSQSFHWMEPESTLAEINRILKPGGIFAAVDCDWPPVCFWQAEQAYEELFRLVRRLEREDPALHAHYIRWDKNRHLDRMRGSGFFTYCREIVFSGREHCNASRFLALAESQGGIQNIRRTHPGLIEAEWSQFERTIREQLGERGFQADFCYRMRIGIKGDPGARQGPLPR